MPFSRPSPEHGHWGMAGAGWGDAWLLGLSQGQTGKSRPQSSSGLSKKWLGWRWSPEPSSRSLEGFSLPCWALGVNYPCCDSRGNNNTYLHYVCENQTITGVCYKGYISIKLPGAISNRILKVRSLFITNFDIIHANFQVTDKEKIPQLAKISCFETRQRHQSWNSGLFWEACSAEFSFQWKYWKPSFPNQCVVI